MNTLARPVSLDPSSWNHKDLTLDPHKEICAMIDELVQNLFAERLIAPPPTPALDNEEDVSYTSSAPPSEALPLIDKSLEKDFSERLNPSLTELPKPVKSNTDLDQEDLLTTDEILELVNSVLDSIPHQFLFGPLPQDGQIYYVSDSFYETPDIPSESPFPLQESHQDAKIYYLPKSFFQAIP
ncbi:MAG TPA: hypothetical protein P5048_01675 [Chlamydiales bacterium]|nr:hypothetical protein [Chlamydiales bacterium]